MLKSKIIQVKPNRMRTKREEIQQAKIFRWHWNLYPQDRMRLFHVDNNSYNAIIGALKKSLGVVSGVSDFVWIGCNGRVVWLEGKVSGGFQSDEQIKFQELVERLGHQYVIFWSEEEFKKIYVENLHDGK